MNKSNIKESEYTMKYYFLELESIEPITNTPEVNSHNMPREIRNTRFTLITDCNENGNHEYLLNHENKEYLIKTAEFFGFQDAREFITTKTEHYDLLYK